MHTSEVFTPGDFPSHTYVEREQQEEEELTNEQELALQVNKQSYVVVVSGPSKSGKTVLVEKVVQDNEGVIDRFVTINGKQVGSGEALWSEIASALSAPNQTSSTRTETDEEGVNASVGANVGPVSANIGGDSRDSTSTEATQTLNHSGLNRVLRMIGGDRTLIYVDDAHYIPQTEHRNIAENIKMGFESGLALVNRCTASASTVRTREMKREIVDAYVENLPLHEESGHVS